MVAQAKGRTSQNYGEHLHVRRRADVTCTTWRGNDMHDQLNVPDRCYYVQHAYHTQYTWRMSMWRMWHSHILTH